MSLRPQSSLIRHRIIEHIPLVRLTDHANPADMEPAVFSRFAIVDAARKFGDAIGITCAFFRSISRTVHGRVDLVSGGACGHVHILTRRPCEACPQSCCYGPTTRSTCQPAASR